jgi:hypothetical protein
MEDNDLSKIVKIGKVEIDENLILISDFDFKDVNFEEGRRLAILLAIKRLTDAMTNETGK